MTIIFLTLQMFAGPITNLSISDTLYNPAVFESSDKIRINFYLEALYATELENEFKYAYDQFNNGVGKINTYSGQFSYIKPSNLIVGLTYRNFNFTAGYELYRSFEYKMERDIYDRDNMQILHGYFFSHGGIYGAYLGLGLKGRVFNFGIKFVNYFYRNSIRANIPFPQNITRKFRKGGIQLFSSFDITDRIRTSLFYSNSVTFFFSYKTFVFTCPPPYTASSSLPVREGLEVVYLPPTDIVTSTSFLYMREGKGHYFQVNFRHNFLDVNAFEFGGGLFKDETDNWGSFLTLGLGYDYGKVGFVSHIMYRYLSYREEDICSDSHEVTSSLVSISLGIRYRP